MTSDGGRDVDGGMGDGGLADGGGDSLIRQSSTRQQTPSIVDSSVVPVVLKKMG